MKKIILLFTHLLILHSLSAQAIEGKYHSARQRYFPQDKNYQIDFFENGLAKIHKDGYIGLIDTAGKVLLEIKYDAVYPFTGNVALIGKDMKYGLINEKGKVLIEPFASEIRKFSHGIAVFRGTNSWDEGLIDEKGKIIVEAKYRFTGEFKEERITFHRDSTYGIMTPQGKEIVIVKNYNHQLSVISSRYDENILKNIQNNSASLFEFNEGLTISYKKKKDIYLFGCIDVNGKDVVPYEFDWISPFRNGTAKALKGEKWGLIDKAGKTILPFEYKEIIAVDSNRFIVCQKNKFGVVNSDNTILLAMKYPALHYLFDDLFITRDSTKYGVVDIHGKQILPFEYEGIAAMGNQGVASWHIQSFSLNTGIPRYQYHGGYFYFDKNGRTDKEEYTFSKLVEGFSDWFEPGYPMENPAFFTPLSPGGSYGGSYFAEEPFSFKKSEEKILSDSEYSFTEKLQGGCSIVGKTIQDTIETANLLPYKTVQKFKKGIIDAEGKLVVPLEYDEITDDKKTVFIVKKENKYGVINLENELIVSIEFDLARMISGGIVVSKQIYTPWPYGDPGEMTYHWEHSLLDLTGKTIRDFSPLDYRESLAGTWLETTGSSSQLIDRKGEKLDPNK